MSNSEIIPKQKRTLIFINIIITCIASAMLATALTTALPAMVQEFNISLSMGQWLTSGYSLAMGIMMPLTAFLINRFPTRKLYITAIILFIAGLILCVIAPNFPLLMCGRVLQACGGGILTAMAQVILLTIYPDNEKGTIMGWYGLAIGAAPVIAPTLAGVLVDLWGWKMIFYITIAIMIVSLLFAIKVISNILDTKKKKFDIYSFILSAIAFGGVTLGIGNIGAAPFVSFQVLGCLLLGIIAGIIFSLRQIKKEDPFLDLKVLKNKKFTLAVIGSVLLYLIMMGASTILPIYVQTILAYSATISGLVVLPGSIAMAVLSPFTGKIYDKVGMKPLFILGALALLLGTAGMAFITMNTPVWLPAIFNVITCMAIGCLMMPLVTWGTSDIEKHKLSDATALLNALRTIAGAIGIVVFVGIMNYISTSSVDTYGKSAPIHGVNIAFLSMAFACVILLIISLIKTDKKTNKVENIELKSIMKTDIYSIKDNETVLDALKFITNKKVSGVPVVNNKNKLVGFISDGDIIRYLSKTYPPFMGPYSFAVIDNDDKDFDEKLNIMMDLKVKNIIKKKVVTIDINTKIEDVCKILADNHLKKAPVTENGKMVGIINRSNITKYAVNSYLSLVK